MSSGHKIFTLFIVVIGELLIAIAGLSLDWRHPWLWPLLAVALPAAGAVTCRLEERRRPLIPREALVEPDLPIPPREPQERHIVDVALPSCLPDYDFRFSARIRWALLEDPESGYPVSPGELAVSAVLERARAVTSRQPPHRCSLAQHQLGGELGTMAPDRTGRVLALAENVSLTLADADRERLSKLSTVRKDEALWEHERKYEQSKRSYLGDDVLKDPGSAVVWHLAKNEDRIEHTVGLIDTLTRLASAANTRDFPQAPEVPPPSGGDGAAGPVPGGPEQPDGDEPDPASDTVHHVGGMLKALGLPLGSPHSAMLARRIAEGVALCYAPAAAEAASAVLDRFATPTMPAAGADDPHEAPDSADKDTRGLRFPENGHRPPPAEPPLPSSQD
ncbi:hypothetical protein ACH4FX_27215 [Streptomyces sp. NPDC018019]|uniref:hypothetical protein n=1 Tax=Streptomyces sp. NPDC018019 TaxID=3365030 RepID=UPI0037AB91C3